MSAIVLPTRDELLLIAYPHARHAEALNAVQDMLGATCKAHGLRIDREDSRWERAELGTARHADYYLFSTHTDPVHPWCCVEAWAHGLPDGSLAVEIVEADEYPVRAAQCSHNTWWRRSRLAAWLWVRWGFFGRDEHLSVSHMIGDGHTSPHVCTPSKWKREVQR